MSLFTGAGGLDLGLEAAGFETRVAVERDTEAVDTLRANRSWQVLAEDIHGRDCAPRALLRIAGVRRGEIDLLAGGPPCQPFSKSGYWHSGDAKRLDDHRAGTMEAYLHVLRETQPEVFLLENVPGLAFSEKDEGLRYLEHQIEVINEQTGSRYSFHARQLNAVEYGIPQTRERVFVIGHREGASFDWPAPTHAKPERGQVNNGNGRPSAPGLEPPRTCWDAIGHLAETDDPTLAAKGKWGDLLPSIPEGGNYLFHTERGAGEALFGWRTRYWSMLLKLAKDQPSWTLTAQPGPAIGPFHWKSRRLSADELCALQTFPAGYQIIGNANRQLGNAVPSALAEILGLAIRRQFFGDRDADPSRPTLLPDRKGPPPPPEPVGPVPEKYLKLIGEHPEHPGTGRGPGAQMRARQLP